MTEFGLTLALALLAAAAAAGLARSALRGEPPARALRQTADTIGFAAASFSRLHLRAWLGTVLLLAFVLLIAFGLARPHLPTDVASSALETGLWVAGTFVLGAIGVLATQLLGLRGVMRAAPFIAASRAPAHNLVAAALRAAAPSGLLSVVVPVCGLLLPAALAWYRFAGLGTPSAAAQTDKLPQLLFGYALGAAVAALLARVFAGVLRGATAMSVNAATEQTSLAIADHTANPAWLARMVSHGLRYATGHCVDFPSSVACTAAASMLLGASLLAANAGRVAPSIGVVLLAPLMLGFGLFACAAGIAVVRAEARENAGRAFERGLAATVVLAITGHVACVRWVFDAHWFWLSVAGVAGVAASVGAILLSRGGGDKTAAGQAELGTAALLLAGLSRGAERAAYMVGIAAAALLAGYLAGARSGLQHGASFGVAITSAAMLLPAAYVSAVQGASSVCAISAGVLLSQTSTGPDAAERANRLSELSVIGARSSAGLASLSVTGVVATMALALGQVVVPASKGGGGATAVELALGTGLALAALGWFFARGLEAVRRAAETAIRDIRVHVGAGVRRCGATLAIEESYDPEHQSCLGMLLQDAARQSIPVGLAGLGALLAVEMSLHLLTARAGLLYAAELVGGALVAAAVAGLVLAFMLEGAASVWRAFRRTWLTKSKYAVDEASKTANNSQHGAAIVSDTVGGPIETLAAPSLQALIRVLVTVTTVLAPLFF